MRGFFVRHYLCDYCSRRQSFSLKGLPKKTRENRCYICNGLFSRLPETNRIVLNALEGTSFSTFQVGITLDPQILEREDELRAKLKIHGNPNIKKELSSLITQTISRDLMAKHSLKNPDIQIKVNLSEMNVEVIRRPITLYGRYTKTRRGIEQKAHTCFECKGYGCLSCDNTGFKNGISIEKALATTLRSIFHHGQFTFTWFGSEDAESLVLGRGRPFIVEVKNPSFRRLQFTKVRGASRNGVTLKKIHLMRERTFIIPHHRISWKVTAELKEITGQLIRQKLESRRQPIDVTFIDKDRTFLKTIWEFELSSLKDRKAWFNLVTDNGFNIRAFFHGEAGRISSRPSVQQILGREVNLLNFDVLDIDLYDSLLPLMNG